MKKDFKKEEVKFEHAEHLSVLILGVLGPVVLIITGLLLLYLRLPAWSMVLGLPTLVIGVVFLIYSYDELITRGLHDRIKDDDSY